MFARPITLVLAATFLIAACSDSPVSPRPNVGSPALSQGPGGGGTGGSSGGGGGGGGGGVTAFVPQPPPTVSVTGTWSATVVGGVPAGVGRTVTLSLTQDLNGHLSGTIANRQIDGTLEPVLGTVSGNSVTVTIGNPCGSCTLEAIFSGTSDGIQISGSLLVLQFTPVVFNKI